MKMNTIPSQLFDRCMIPKTYRGTNYYFAPNEIIDMEVLKLAYQGPKRYFLKNVEWEYKPIIEMKSNENIIYKKYNSNEPIKPLGYIRHEIYIGMVTNFDSKYTIYKIIKANTGTFYLSFVLPYNHETLKIFGEPFHDYIDAMKRAEKLHLKIVKEKYGPTTIHNN